MQVNFEYTYAPAPRYSAQFPHTKLYNIISANNEHYNSLLQQWKQYAHHLTRIKYNQQDTDSQLEPFWNNNFFSSLDAISLYCILATTNPKLYVEVGSGNSTKFARLAITNHKLRTKIISIDPHPRAEIDLICDSIIRQPVEDTSPTFFQDLPIESVVFIDNSHRSFQNSDVTTFFLEILPSLKKDIIFGLHDIFLPYDYPINWINEKRFYNEQYLLAAYLLGGHTDSSTFFPCHYISSNTTSFPALQAYSEMFKFYTGGGCFWLKKTSTPSAIDLQATNAFVESKKIHLNNKIDSKDLRFPSLLGKGWSTIEHDHVWSIGPLSSISFDPSLLGHKFFITLSCIAFICEQHSKQEYIFYDKNNNILKKTEITHPNRRFSVKIMLEPETMTSPSGILEIFIACNDAVSPAAVNYSSDKRDLGLALVSIEISA
jgi:hypothetical protein